MATPNYADWLRLKRLAAMDPFAANIKERVTFPTTPTIKDDFNSSPLVPEAQAITEPTLLDSLRNRQTPKMKDYMAYLDDAPNKKDYELNKLGKVLSAVAAISEGGSKGAAHGINTYKGLTEMPYIEAQEEWGRKGGRLKEQADIEYRGLADEQKLAIQMEDYRLKKNEDIRQELELESKLELDEKQLENIENQIKARGLTKETSEIDGITYIVDAVNKTRTPIAQFAMTYKDKKLGESIEWFSRQRQRTADAKTLQDRTFAQQLNMESIRTLNDGELARYRQILGREDDEIKRKLEGMSTAAQRTALNLALEQTTLDFPNLDRTKEPEKFMTEVRKRLKNIRKRTDKDVETIIGEDPAGLFD